MFNCSKYVLNLLGSHKALICLLDCKIYVSDKWTVCHYIVNAVLQTVDLQCCYGPTINYRLLFELYSKGFWIKCLEWSMSGILLYVLLYWVNLCERVTCVIRNQHCARHSKWSRYPRWQKSPLTRVETTFEHDLLLAEPNKKYQVISSKNSQS